MADNKWSEAALRAAEAELADHANGTWHEMISKALDAAIEQRRREDQELMNKRLKEKINELEGHA